ncbi:uncharacterized protein LOC142550153 [Primulina tabacum]|uniref:uncharacterized protein LOC142550153 n=1 Tax=Primulina tabacum TaxID=48773 RepID=UPI003F59B7BC
MGHTPLKCPLSSGNGKVQGKIFAMTKESVNPDSSVISGNILTNGKEAITLIDTGATHSFISEVFMHFISVEPTVMPLHFNIVFPSGDEICATSIIKACPIQVGNRLLFADLILIPMVAFDVIFGMDWLSAYRAVIDCVGKTVKFLADDHDSDVFVGLGSSMGIPIISCLQANKLLNKGCMGFLASVVDVRKESNLQLQDIDVVQDYPDVFADDVPGLPPDREVEFVIDLIPGAAIFSKIDLRSGYHQLKVKKEDIAKTAFRTRNEINLVSSGTVARLSALVLHSTLFDRILKEQQLDTQLLELKRKSDLTGVSVFGSNRDGLLTFRGKICVPIGDDIRKDVLLEAHTVPYSVKIEHQRPAGLLQSLPIPQWKWEHITMDFVTGLPRTQKGFNSIWVIVDRLTKSSHFLPVKTTYSMNQYAEAYIQEIVRLHGIPELVQQTADVVALIQERMRTAQSRQKSYADVRRRPVAFEVGDHVFIKIAPLKGVMRFGKKGKLSPRYIGTFEILDKIGDRAYRLALPPDLERVHNVFHVSMLRKYLPNPSHVLRHESLDLLPNLSYEEMPVQILDRKVKVLRNKEIGLVKVLWRNHVIEEAWEPEEEMKHRYPNLFDGNMFIVGMIVIWSLFMVIVLESCS